MLMMKKWTPRSALPKGTKSQVSEVRVDLDTRSGPMPIDTVGLAHTLGLRHNVLWWAILKRKDMYTTHVIPKPKGVRKLHEPNLFLKKVQKRIINRIFSKLPVEDHYGAYEDGRGVKYTVYRHAGHATIIELDIKDFFGSTRRRYVREYFTDLGWPIVPAKAIADLLTYPITPNKSVVPQGAPTSPRLCNLVGNKRLDAPIRAYLAGLDTQWVYTRYSDNLIMSHPDVRDRTEVDSILSQAKKIAVDGGYTIHPDKIKVMRAKHPKKAQRLLGLSVGKYPNLSQVQYKKLRAQVHRANTLGFAAVSGLPKTVDTPGKALEHLRGLINYYLYINPTPRMQKLKAEFDSAVTKFNAA